MGGQVQEQGRGGGRELSWMGYTPPDVAFSEAHTAFSGAHEALLQGEALSLLVPVSSSRPSPAPTSCKHLSLCPQQVLNPGWSFAYARGLRGIRSLTPRPPGFRPLQGH